MLKFRFFFVNSISPQSNERLQLLDKIKMLCENTNVNNILFGGEKMRNGNDQNNDLSKDKNSNDGSVLFRGDQLLQIIKKQYESDRAAQQGDCKGTREA